MSTPEITPIRTVGSPKRKEHRQPERGDSAGESSPDADEARGDDARGSGRRRPPETPRITPDDLPQSERLNVGIDREKIARAKKILGRRTFSGVVYEALRRLYDDLRREGYDV